MEPQTAKASNTFLITSLLLCSLATIAVSFYFFYYKKDYEFIVEVPCDISIEGCFQRDCSNPDDCPPNGFSDFKRYSLNAADFSYCKDEDCSKACQGGQIQCTLIECEENIEAGESCSYLPTIQ